MIKKPSKSKFKKAKVQKLIVKNRKIRDLVLKKLKLRKILKVPTKKGLFFYSRYSKPPRKLSLVWDPAVVSSEDYASLVNALGDVVRAHQGSGVVLVDSSSAGMRATEEAPA